jgi:hypothetical protein
MASADVRGVWAHAAELNKSGEAASRISALTGAGAPPPQFVPQGPGFDISGMSSIIAAQNFMAPNFPTPQSTAYQPNSKASNSQPSMQDTITAASERFRSGRAYDAENADTPPTRDGEIFSRIKDISSGLKLGDSVGITEKTPQDPIDGRDVISSSYRNNGIPLEGFSNTLPGQIKYEFMPKRPARYKNQQGKWVPFEKKPRIDKPTASRSGLSPSWDRLTRALA